MGMPGGRPIGEVLIVGGGFSGTLQAINLVRHDGPRTTLVERRSNPARGVAYSAKHADHLLNVRASRMSAFPDRQDHFLDWLVRRGLGDASSFIPRSVYGDYLVELLAETKAEAGERLTILSASAVDLQQDGARTKVMLEDGRQLSADAVILSVGNLPPHDPPGIDLASLPSALYVSDPWASGLADGLGIDDTVLLVGTGLTMIDAALRLEAEGFPGRILALSRRGLLPRIHDEAPHASSPGTEWPPASPTRLLRHVRKRADEIGWRQAVDELRPATQNLWRAAGEEDQARFLRHLRPWWDVHRHRIAPEVGDRIDALRSAGRMTVAAGKIQRVENRDGAAVVHWRERGQDEVQGVRVSRIVNCTGPQGDLLRTSEPLLQRLLASGLIRPDRHRLGLEVNAQSQVIAADGTAAPNLFAIGPMTRGCFWEIVAVPDIRSQVWSLGRYLSNAHWVGGEGL